MANGEVCKNCGYQETAHDLGRAMLPNGEECFDFKSTGSEVGKVVEVNMPTTKRPGPGDPNYDPSDDE